VSASESFEIERYTRVVNDVFYGLNPDALKFVDFDVNEVQNNYALQLFRLTPVILALLAGGVALLNLQKGPLYWYVFSCILLIAFATLPYTGWLLGYFVSARLISRASWFSPLGIGSVLVLAVAKNWWDGRGKLVRLQQFGRFSKILSGTMIGLISCVVFISPILMSQILPRIPKFFEVLYHNKQLAQVGTYITQNTTGSVVAIALDPWDTQLLPGVSSHVSLISFREEKYDNLIIIFYRLKKSAKEFTQAI